jgi:hypothetical protein
MPMIDGTKPFTAEGLIAMAHPVAALARQGSE